VLRLHQHTERENLALVLFSSVRCRKARPLVLCLMVDSFQKPSRLSHLIEQLSNTQQSNCTAALVFQKHFSKLSNSRSFVRGKAGARIALNDHLRPQLRCEMPKWRCQISFLCLRPPLTNDAGGIV